MLDAITIPRTPIHVNIARAARAVLIPLLLELVMAIILTITAPGWQGIVMIVVLAILAGLTVRVNALASKAASSPWHVWLLPAVVWLSLNLFNLFVAGAATPFAITNILFTISIAALLFGRARSTPVMLAGVGTTLPILLIDFVLRPGFRLQLPPSFGPLLPSLVVAITAALLLFLLQQFALFSLRQKLIISFLLLSLIPVAAIRYLYDVSFRAALTESASQNLASVAAQTAGSIDAFISGNLDAVAIQSRLPAFQRLLTIPPDDPAYAEAFQAAEAQMYSLQELHGGEEGESYLVGHSLIDREGIVILDTSFPQGRFNPELGQDLSGDAIFLTPSRIGMPYASPLRVTSDMQSSRIYFAHRIADEDNRPAGVFTVSYNARFLQDLLEENKALVGPGSYGVLFDEHNIYLAHALLPDLVFRSVDGLDPAVYDELVDSGRLPDEPNAIESVGFSELGRKLENSSSQPTFAVSDITNDNTTNQVATSRLANYSWQVAYFQPEADFLAPVNNQTVFSLLLSGVIAAIAVLVALFASNQLAGPVLRLTEAAEEVTAGNLNVRANVDAKDEVGTLAIAFNSMTRQLRQTLEGLEELVAVRTARLEATNEVGRVASSILNRDDLIASIVNLITDRFGYYYAAIFLVDEQGVWAELKDATGDAGRLLKAQGHRLQISGKNMVGLAIRTYTPRIAQDVDEEKLRFANPLLPETRSEIALPLVVGDHVIGALDVQSKQIRAFDQQVIDTLQTLANQVSIAIENANLFERTQRAVRTQQQLNEFTANIQRATDISAILTTTISELSGMLDTSEISIQLAPEDELKKTNNGAIHEEA